MINRQWDNVLKEEMSKDYFKQLGRFVKKEYRNKKIFPPYEDIFAALRLTDCDEVEVIVLGQDPYHGEGEAHGLCFSVREGIRKPPSLLNIIKELNNDLGIKREESDLTDWAKQGVLLLNAIMTVEQDKPLSHKGKGWEEFTDAIIKKLNEREEPVIFLLWGSYARSKKEFITNSRHPIIESVHPSPLSANRGFFSSKPFSKINKILSNEKRVSIKW
jgi:uracil-DNA glycosylase